jgi:threonine dehydrogenase-like Zn-dependent dehydrogenase
MNATEAFVITAPGHGELRRWDLAPGEVTIEVESCGLCQRDTGIWTGRIARDLPDVPGHEVVGRVLDPGPTDWPEGTRVAGMGVGGLARHMRVPAWHLAPVPGSGPQLSMVEPLACAVNAVEQDPVAGRDAVGGAERGAGGVAVVVGLGLLGQLIAALLAAAGRPVVCADRDPSRRELAESLGLTAVAPESSQLAAAIATADSAYECTGHEAALWRLTDQLPPGAGLVLVGHHQGGTGLAGDLLNQWHLRGLAVRNAVPRTAPDMAACVRRAAALPVDLSRYPFRSGPIGSAGRLLGEWPRGRILRNVVLVDGG